MVNAGVSLSLHLVFFKKMRGFFPSSLRNIFLPTPAVDVQVAAAPSLRVRRHFRPVL